MLSELEVILRRRRAYSDEEVFNQFVAKFGAPAEVANGYALEATDDDDPKPLIAYAVKPIPREWRGLTWFIPSSALLLSCAMFVFAQGNTTPKAGDIINAGAGAVIQFDMETMLCATRVHSSRRGDHRHPQSNEPAAALGLPNCTDSGRQHNTFYSLGLGGELVVEFTEGWLCDGPGADLAIFEIGSGEPVEVAVSADEKNWIKLTTTTGGMSAIDLEDFGLTKKRFRFVRLVDPGTHPAPKPEFWGADIDAVVAIHSVRK
jgi:hypothetical protein